MKMKSLLVISCLLCFGALASAANMAVDFTTNPTTFNFDSFWDTQSSTATSFTGTFLSDATATGSDVFAIVNQNEPTELLDTLTLNFSGGSGGAGEETFGGSVVTGINGSSSIPTGAIVVDATGSYVNLGATNYPANITLQEKANSPAVTPEPGSLVLFGTALIGLGLVSRRRFGK
ncbi:MAG: PEP-CTERM sorting domain-containing protein, partial [Terriglobia bacterium]